jgi:hypothetical protein
MIRNTTVQLPAQITPEQLASFLAIPMKTLSRWRSDDKGPDFTRLGKYVRYDADDVARWMDGPERNAVKGSAIY